MALSGTGRAAVLLILPLITYMPAGRHVAHSYACPSIGNYIRTQLSPQVDGGFGWEQWLQGRRSAVVRYRGANPLLITFPGISVPALLGSLPYLVGRSLSATTMLLWLSWAVGLLLTGLSVNLTWKVRGDSFLRTGPAASSELDLPPHRRAASESGRA